MPYVHFTEEQIYRANAVNLEHFLHLRGEKLIRSGREQRLASDHSVTVRGNAWYDHSSETGGLAIDFIRHYLGLSFPDAVTRLLGGETGAVYEVAKREARKEPKSFALPPAHTDMRRVFAYLLKNRLLDRDILSQFAKEKLVYESCETAKNKQGEAKEYHNAIFVGLDVHGKARHAHKRGLYTEGGYKGNVDGSDPAYSFHRIGTSNRLHVFESPIDLLSFLSLHPDGWQAHSYVALCGVAEHAMLHMLNLYPHLREVTLCLDHDEAGIEAVGRLAETLAGKGYDQVSFLWSAFKDWNEDIKAEGGMDAIPAEDHPQLLLCASVCDRIALLQQDAPKSPSPENRLPDLLREFKKHIQGNNLDRALAYAEDMAALSLHAAAREYRQMGRTLSSDELSAMLQAMFKPHQNRGNIHNLVLEIAIQLQTAQSLQQAVGLRSPEQKKNQADAWMSLALGCVKAAVSMQIQEQKQERRQKQTEQKWLWHNQPDETARLLAPPSSIQMYLS